MPLNLLEDTRSQEELGKVITTFLLKEKAKKSRFGWLRAGLGSAEGFISDSSPHLSQTAKGTGVPCSPKLDCLQDFSLRAVFPVVMVALQFFVVLTTPIYFYGQ